MKEDSRKESGGFFDENDVQIASVFASVNEVVGNTIKTLSLQKKKGLRSKQDRGG